MNAPAKSTAPDFVWTPAHDAQLLTLQVAELYRFAPVMVASAFVGSVLTLAVFFDDQQRSVGLYWFAYACAVVLYRVIVIVARENRKRERPRLWANLIILGNLLAGVKWGLLGTFLYPEGHGYREIFAVMLITSYVGGSITAYAAVKWAHAALSIPAAVPAAIYLFFFHTGMHAAAGAAGMFLVTATIYFAIQEHGRIAERLKLGIQNHNLMHQLHHANARLVSENRSLAHRAAVRLKRARAAQGRVDLLALHFEQSPLPMLECDARYRLLDWNDAAVSFFGSREQDLLGRSIIENLFTQASRDAHADALMSLVHEKQPASLSVTVHDGEGGIWQCELHVTPVLPDDAAAARVGIIISGLQRVTGTGDDGSLRQAT